MIAEIGVFLFMPRLMDLHDSRDPAVFVRLCGASIRNDRLGWGHWRCWFLPSFCMVLPSAPITAPPLQRCTRGFRALAARGRPCTAASLSVRAAWSGIDKRLDMGVRGAGVDLYFRLSVRRCRAGVDRCRLAACRPRQQELFNRSRRMNIVNRRIAPIILASVAFLAAGCQSVQTTRGGAVVCRASRPCWCRRRRSKRLRQNSTSK